MRVTGVTATTSRERPALLGGLGSSATTLWTSVVAPPTSTTATSPAPGSVLVEAAGQQLDPGEHDVGRRAADHPRGSRRSR